MVSNSAAMTCWILRSGGSVRVRKVWPRRMTCSWVGGSEGERAWEARRVRSARRYFSASGLVLLRTNLEHWP